jgi:mannose-6-phosphate isomerase
MNTINKFYIRNSKRTFLLMLWLLSLSSAIGQEQVPERRLSAEQMRRPEIAAIAGRLGQLRRNEARFGPKHPASETTKKQISDLENQLREMTVDRSAIEPENSARDPLSSPKKRGDNGVSEKKMPPKRKIPSQWGFETWSSWPSTVGQLTRISRKHSNYHEAYPWLGIPDLIAVGPMPGMGLMWGVQYDSRENFSSVFQWFDDPGSTQRAHYLDLPGRVLSVYYPSNFDSTGCFWVIRQTPNQEFLKNDAPEGWLIAEVIQMKADRFPPYGIEDQTPSSIGVFKIRGKQTPTLLASQQRGFFIVGDVQFSQHAESIEKLCAFGEGIWGLDCATTNATAMAANLISECKSISAPSNLDILSYGIDSVGRVLLVDHAGRVRRRNGGADRAENDGVWPPKTLSQLGWYSSLVDGAMIESFKRFSPGDFSEMSDLNTSSVSASLGRQAHFSDRFTTDHWISIPQTNLVTNSQNGRWKYPDGTLLVQTINQLVPEDNATECTTRKIETRVLSFIDQEWFAMSYLWDSEQTDGVLVESDDQTTEIEMADQTEPLTWHPSKASECFRCHTNGPIGNPPIQILKLASESLPSSVRWDMHFLGSADRGKKVGWTPILAAQGQGGITKVRQTLGGERLDLDWGWFKKSLLEENIKPWYQASFRPSGFFCSELDETWTPSLNPSATLVSQTRQIYKMAIGYSISKDPELLDAMRKGIRFLLDKFKDPKYGGFYLQVSEQGTVIEKGKDGYGHALVIYALATAAKVSGDDAYATEALKCWEHLRSRMMEIDGGLMWKASEDFSNPYRRSQNPNMQLFEGLLELYDATKDRGVYSDALRLLNFVVLQLRQDSGCIPEDFQSDWRSPVMIGQQPNIQMGHQVQWAFLISRAVELGFPRRYAKIGQEFMDYAMIHGFDQETGGLYQKPGTDKEAWQQAEFLRALLRYYSMHDRSDYADAILKTHSMIRREFIDPEHGRWIESGKTKEENDPKIALHEVGMYLEAIRVDETMQSKIPKGAE